MALSDFVAAVVAVLRRRPSDILPMYLLGVALTAVVRVVPFLAVAVAYLSLATTGRLAAIRTHLADLDSPPDPNADPEAFEAWASGLEPVVEQLLTPSLVALAGVTVVASLVLFVLGSAVVAAGQLAACYGRLRNNRGLVAGLAGARRYWPRFLGLFVLEFLCWAVVLGTVGVGTALFAGAASLATQSAVLAAPVVLLAIPVTIAVLAVVRALFAFAPVAVVVDDAGVFGSLRRAAGFVRAQPVGAAFYCVLAVGSIIALSTISGLLSLVDVVALGSLLTSLVLFPILDLLKTALYCGHRNRLSPPEPPTRSVREQLRTGLRRGWTELTAFVRARPGTHALVVGLAVLGFGAGWLAAEPVAGTFETSIAARLEGHFPPAAAIELFGNNWLVAFTTAYGGVALALPAIVSLLFNGVSMGVIARLEVAPTELAAFVVPHGLLEIPAILIATALGISVGRVAWRTWRGRAGRPDLADALERAFWVLIGIGLLLAVAAVIEGFVSPYYYRPFV
ncbi:stage II sporulation protein M [Natrinema salifodinae]|uniref:Stage II sporulation protein M n=1 Tax=Natrinema salifodinae TaxID=1202768 RepID=A0A1I0PAG8_9EURY|nr:stage II sporulation protein M [Natrinema salifodinae]SEW11214.1 Stage II sporulation protein M [Natrinema salifodinae]